MDDDAVYLADGSTVRKTTEADIFRRQKSVNV
jgi:hypothetical protein